jgi:2-keto-4-pentenoate hydratase/2-oxohepta-3-ene-1,7-dioic acid hydratase in catechol pathway
MSVAHPHFKPTKIVCVGRNYAEHAKELGNVVPDRPLLFLKPPSALLAPGAAIVLPADSTQVEHEGEIGVVIGQRIAAVSEDDALAAVAGIVCVNDVTARDLQRLDAQWTRAKGFDTFCPAGPEPAPLNAWGSWRELVVSCRVNGVERQRGQASEMVFGIPFLIAYISRIMTLEPGDLIATGSPPGVGPLAPGDRVEVEIPGVGVLSNPVEAGPR